MPKRVCYVQIPVELAVSSCMCNHTCDVPLHQGTCSFIRRIDIYYITPADVPHPVMYDA